MLFDSFEFILFCPLSVFLYYSFNKISVFWGKISLLVVGLCLYSFSGIENTFYIITAFALNYSIVKMIDRHSSQIWLIIGIIINIMVLCFYKFRFIIQPSYCKINAPIGVSFITFQFIALILYATRDHKKIGFIDSALFMTYFPKMLMGPLMEPKQFHAQINDTARKSISIDNIVIGLELFTFGLFKKLYFANTFSKVATWGIENRNWITGFDLIIMIIAYSFRIYFDFSGYSDMATGISLLFNIDLPINFDSPYKACSITNFWKKWHISLTSFFTNNIYIPLGGGKKSIICTCTNILIVFLISGLWHGSTVVFLMWGLAHGCLMIIERILKKVLVFRLPKIIGWLYMFVTVSVLWMFFYLPSLSDFIDVLRRVMAFNYRYTYITYEMTLQARTFGFELLCVFPVVAAIIRSFPEIPITVLLISAAIVCLLPTNAYSMFMVKKK